VPHTWSLVTADLSGAPLDVVDGDDVARILERTLASRIGPIAWRVHRFEPRGTSLVGVAVRGRVIVHTWPERAALTIDLYAEHAQMDAALAASVEALMTTERGGRATAASGAGSRRRPA
jgi:S-adenosylmethionine/arginine decarboxylase-like enzyme